eukprot:TRINITY_DN3421_c0_g1_i1.p1 TRINITY_DN3421_c0_g1~~TRINITY_DN3421_c0_g1_i1.p1  ORF type:complete len:548 (+),score=137.42 TRINITY_DN3421_c0_g1_i1:75-1718(+)
MGGWSAAQSAAPVCSALLLVLLWAVWRDAETQRDRNRQLRRANDQLRSAVRLASEQPIPRITDLDASAAQQTAAAAAAEAAAVAVAAAEYAKAAAIQGANADAQFRALGAPVELRFGNVSTERLASAVHCIGQEPGRSRPDPNAWKRASCHYRNICYDPAKEDFVYLRAPGDDFDPQRSAAALGAINAQWEHRDAVLMRWAPRVVDLPAEGAPRHRLAAGDEVWIPHAEHCAANVMHLLLDQFLPWYASVMLFGLNRLRMRPLRVRVKEKALWGTCDFIREAEVKGAGWAQHYPHRCDRNMQRWLPTMLPGHSVLLETGRSRGKSDKPQTPFAQGAEELRCFPHAVAGVGVLSDHCLRSHGWGWDPNNAALHDCNQGRGALLWAFRSHLLANAFGTPPPTPPRHRIVLQAGGQRVSGGQWRQWTLALQEAFGPRGAQVWSGDPAALSAAEQMRQMAASTVAVAAMGGNAVTALFLPRGAALVIAWQGKDRLDWDFWTHASWLRAVWISSVAPAAQLVTVVGRELERYEAFRPRQVPFDRLQVPIPAA